MKKASVILMTLFIALLLCACSGRSSVLQQIQVSLVETGDFAVAENGQWIEAGGDAVFQVYTNEGVTITGVDYAGDYTLTYGDGVVVLEFRNIQYPQRIGLQISTDVKGITYDPNCGGLEPVSQLYDTQLHTRPNTATDLFERDGYTLVCWNTEPDGTGIRVGLGSRVTVDSGSLVLYAQWEPWTDQSRFGYVTEENGVTITQYMGADPVVVIPAEIDGLPVTRIDSEAFVAVEAEQIILPNTIETVENGAFRLCGFRSMVLFDNVETISDGAFQSCYNFTTLYINAVEDPYGYQFRRESLLADKVDLLIAAQGQRKLVCYGGCSMWYNLDSKTVRQALGDNYRIINMALNGTVNSFVQMEIILAYMEPGDVLFHTPELFSQQQLLLDLTMDEGDDKLWCGLEYNYDLLTYVDISRVTGLFDSFCAYLSVKEPGGSYLDEYTDSRGCHYMDAIGCVPFTRTETSTNFGKDAVELEPGYLENGLPKLTQMYQRFAQQGVQVYVSYACINMEGIPVDQRQNVTLMDELFHAAVEDGGWAETVSILNDYLFGQHQMYDTNYHLLTEAAIQNTEKWLRDLVPYLDIE